MPATNFFDCNQHTCYINSTQMHSLFFVQLSSCSDRMPSKNLNKTIINCAKCPFPQYLHLCLIYTAFVTDRRGAVITLKYRSCIHKGKKIYN